MIWSQALCDTDIASQNNTSAIKYDTKYIYACSVNVPLDGLSPEKGISQISNQNVRACVCVKPQKLRTYKSDLSPQTIPEDWHLAPLSRRMSAAERHTSGPL